MDDASFAARVGTTVHAEWHLDSLLGVGGMAAVYAATDRAGKQVALKILHREYQDDAKILTRFRREAEVGALDLHPAIVRVHPASFLPLLDGEPTAPAPPREDSAEEDESPNTERTIDSTRARAEARTGELVRTEDGEPFVVMELLQGESIRDLWRRSGRTLPLQESLHIAERVVDCLIACHDAGIIHRDLKPANIFRTQSDEIKVLDFGVAQVQGSSLDLDAAGTALGTPAYLAPEQAMGLAAQLDGRSDLFSVGALLHALITGHRLHAGRTPQESLLLAATKPVPSIVHIAPNLPQPVIRLIDKALAWDRRKRFTDAREMHEAILAAATLAQAWDDDARDKVLAAPPPDSLAPRPLLLQPEYSPRHSISLAPNADVSGVKQAFALLNDVLLAVREFGWNHPTAERALARAYEAIVKLIEREHAWGQLTLRPYAFSSRGVTVWEPPAPFDAIPHRLFSSGVRKLGLTPDLEEGELKELLSVFLLDPEKDLAIEDNHATKLWESALPSISFVTVEPSSEGDLDARAAFWSAAETWQRTIEDRAAALEAQGSTETAGATDLVVLPADERAALLARLVEEEQVAPAHHVAALARAFAHVASIGEAGAVLRAFREASEAELGLGHFDELCTFFENMCGELRTLLTTPSVREPLLVALADALFGGGAFVLLGRYLAATPADIFLVRPILELLGPADLPQALEAARDASPELRELFLDYAARVGGGHEAEIAAAAEGLEADATYAFLETLKRIDSNEGANILRALAKGEDAASRVAASIVLCETEEERSRELALLLGDKTLAVRLHALRSLQRNATPSLLPEVRKLVTDAGAVTEEEAFERMRTLLALDDSSGTQQTLEIAKKSGIFVSKTRETVRISACRALGEHSSDRGVASTLDDIAKARLGTSEDVRKAARRAARAIRERADADDADETDKPTVSAGEQVS